jgi:uncharacterized protein Smg (DUF494 family)
MENPENKAIDIIIYLAQYVKDDQSKVGNLIEALKDLRELGFSEVEIKRAYLWFLSRLPKFLRANKEKCNLCSWLKGFKDENFTPESYGFLYQMEELGVLDGKEIELLIQKSLALGKQKIEIQTVKNLANILLFSDSNIREQAVDFLWTEQEMI